VTDVGAEAVALAQELVRIDSTNPSLVPGGAGERETVEHLRERLTRSGFETTVVPAGARGDRPGLVAIPQPSAGRRDDGLVVLNGHLDTVGTAGMAAPFEARVEGDRLGGRGAADMKAGVAAAVVASEHLSRSAGNYRVGLALVADEEDASLGSEAVLEALPGLGVHPDVCVIAEPTDLALARSLRGFALVRVRFPGRAAHTSQPEQGIDAIAHLGRFLAAVDERAAAVRRNGGELMVSRVRGGTSPFVVADSADCLVERRTVPGEAALSALQEVHELLDPSWRAEVELVAHREAWQLDDEGPAAELASRLGAALGTGPTFDAPYWREAPLWQQVCPTLVCGPSGGGLHSVDEWVDVRQVRAFAEALVATLSAAARPASVEA
jgi:acetylornithine deacetylase